MKPTDTIPSAASLLAARCSHCKTAPIGEHYRCVDYRLCNGCRTAFDMVHTSIGDAASAMASVSDPYILYAAAAMEKEKEAPRSSFLKALARRTKAALQSACIEGFDSGQRHQMTMTRRDRCFLIGKRMRSLAPLQAGRAWFHLAGALEEMGELDIPKFRHVIRSIRVATIWAKRP